MSPAINASELSVGQLGEQAAQAIRTLNQPIRPAMDALSDPAEAAELVAALAWLAGGLPQLLGQLNRWLVCEQRAGRLRVDACSTSPDPAAAIDAVAGCLGLQGAQCASGAGRALAAAHQHPAHLAATEPEDES